MSNFTVQWKPSGRGQARCSPDPHFPSGKSVNLAGNKEPNCTIRLDYPAPECGIWYCRCDTCGITVGVTAAGRPDDPTTVRVPCMPGSPA